MIKHHCLVHAFASYLTDAADSILLYTSSYHSVINFYTLFTINILFYTFSNFLIPIFVLPGGATVDI